MHDAPSHRSATRQIEDLRLALDGLDAAAAAIAAALHANTLSPDGVYQLLQLATRALQADVDALARTMVDP